MRIIDGRTVEQAVAWACENGMLDGEDTLVFFFDCAVLADRIARLTRAFPQDALHAIAIKTNPLSFVLRYLVQLGVGLEAASLGELLLAERAGVPWPRLVFDSPAKTQREIDLLPKQYPGLRVNADSLDEVARHACHSPDVRLGLRINPLVRATSNEALVAAGPNAKFGESIDHQAEILLACRANENLDGFHVHVSSQYADPEPTLTAIRSVVDLAGEINQQLGQRRITTIDIGGGFPVNYYPGAPFLIEDFARQLETLCPELFDGRYQLVTEFGRYVHAQAAFALTTVEYVKRHGDGSVTAITHAGADTFVRECYQPVLCHHEISALDRTTLRRKVDSDRSPTHIAGPLCFGGDVVARSVPLPALEPGDRIVVHDAGANTLALFSRHCSRPFPTCLAFDSRAGFGTMAVIRPRESLASLAAFW